MNGAWLVAGLILLAVVAATFAWRYYGLRRQLVRYALALRTSPSSEEAGESREVDDLAGAINSRISDFRRQLSDLRDEHDRLAAVLEQMTDGVLIADADGKVQFANPAVDRLFASPQPVGRTVTEVLRHHQLVEAWRRCRETGQLQSESLELPARRQFLQLIVMPDRHAHGSLLLVQDLTRVRRLETVRRDFISNISHELRTPLASLKALTETLKGGALADEEAGPWFLERISAEVDALSQMAQELLDLSRIEAGQVELQLADWPPEQLLHSAAERMQLQAERAQVELRVESATNLPVVQADQSRVEQVLVNLIHNAVKFTPPGGKVILSAELGSAGDEQSGGADNVCFTVSDTGVGIPADELERIFERFYRVDKARSGGSTGLGLSISRHLVEAHGGRIWVESTEGTGSTFHFTIPTGQPRVL